MSFSRARTTASDPPRERESRPAWELDGRHLAGSDDNQRVTRTAPSAWTAGRIARERVRAHLRHLAASAGRPVRTLADERVHAAARRRGEAARIARVGE